MLADYFATLEDWKMLPAYKLEPRIDSLVGFSLTKISERLTGFPYRTVIPEFPIRLGTIDSSLEGTDLGQLSDKVDFYL